MNMNRKWMTLILLILGAMIVSGCAELTMNQKQAINEGWRTFQ